MNPIERGTKELTGPLLFPEARGMEFLRPVSEMSWEEEVLGMEDLVGGTVRAYEDGNELSKTAFALMIGPWKKVATEFNIPLDPQLLQATIVENLQASLRVISLHKTRPGRLIGGKFISYNYFERYNPRELRVGIMRHGLDGKEIISDNLICYKEAIKRVDTYDRRFSNLSMMAVRDKVYPIKEDPWINRQRKI